MSDRLGSSYILKLIFRFRERRFFYCNFIVYIVCMLINNNYFNNIKIELIDYIQKIVLSWLDI